MRATFGGRCAKRKISSFRAVRKLELLREIQGAFRFRGIGTQLYVFVFRTFLTRTGIHFA